MIAGIRLSTRGVEKARLATHTPSHMRLAVLFFCVCLGSVGCDRVPDLTFADAAASDTLDATTTDALGEGTGGPTSDAAPLDSSGADVTPASCGAGGTECCGQTPCIDLQGQTCNCADCTQTCGQSRVCCFDSQGNLTCKPNANACH